MKYMRRTAGYTWTDYKTNSHIAKDTPGVCDVMHFVCHKWKTNIVWAGALYSLWKQWVCARLVVKWFEWHYEMLLYQTDKLV